MAGVGFFDRGDYVPAPDGRRYGDLSSVERLEVVENYYSAYWQREREEREALADEVDRVLAMPDRAARLFHMEQVLISRPEQHARLAALVRFEFRRRRGLEPLAPITTG
jgi:hypothetical protein